MTLECKLCIIGFQPLGGFIEHHEVRVTGLLFVAMCNGLGLIALQRLSHPVPIL